MPQQSPERTPTETIKATPEVPKSLEASKETPEQTMAQIAAHTADAVRDLFARGSDLGNRVADAAGMPMDETLVDRLAEIFRKAELAEQKALAALGPAKIALEKMRAGRMAFGPAGMKSREPESFGAGNIRIDGPEDATAVRTTANEVGIRPRDADPGRAVPAWNREQFKKQFEASMLRLLTRPPTEGERQMADLWAGEEADLRERAQRIDLSKNDPRRGSKEKVTEKKRRIRVPEPREFFFGRKTDFATDQPLVGFLLETELADAGMRALKEAAPHVVSRGEIGENADSMATYLEIGLFDQNKVAEVRRAIAKRAERAYEQIVELADGLEAVRKEKGETEMLRELVQFAYGETVHVDGTNDMLSVFAPEEGHPREANCDGKARAMSVVLKELGYTSQQIKWEVFNGHVRVVVESKDNGPLLLEANVQSWKHMPGRAVFKAREIEGHVMHGEPLNFERAGIVWSPSGEVEYHPSAASEKERFRADRGGSVAQKKSNRRTSVTRTVLAPSSLEAFGSDNPSAGRAEEPGNAEIKLGDPELLELEDRAHRMAAERGLPEPEAPDSKMDVGAQKIALEKTIETILEKPVVEKPEEKPKLTEAAVISGREALKQPLYARLLGMDRKTRLETLSKPGILERWGREFKVTALLLAGVAAADPIYDFGNQFVKDVAAAAMKLDQESEEAAATSSKAETPMATTEAQIEVYSAKLDDAVNQSWATTFDGIDYQVRLSAEPRSFDLKGGGTAGSASLERTHGADGWHDVVSITPSLGERKFSGSFLETMARELRQESLKSPGEQIQRVVEIHSPDTENPISVEMIDRMVEENARSYLDIVAGQHGVLKLHSDSEDVQKQVAKDKVLLEKETGTEPLKKLVFRLDGKIVDEIWTR